MSRGGNYNNASRNEEQKNCGQRADINYVYTSTYFKHNIIHNILPYIFLNNAVATVGIVI